MSVLVFLVIPVSSFVVDKLMSDIYGVIDYKSAVCWFFVCFAVSVLFSYLEEKYNNQVTILMSKVALIVLLETVVVFILRLVFKIELPIILI